MKDKDKTLQPVIELGKDSVELLPFIMQTVPILLEGSGGSSESVIRYAFDTAERIWREGYKRYHEVNKLEIPSEFCEVDTDKISFSRR